MLVEEDGPGKIFRRIRELSGVEYASDSDDIISYNDYTPLHCTYCTSVWVVAVTWFFPEWFHRLMAISAGAILVDVVESFIQTYKREKVE